MNVRPTLDQDKMAERLARSKQTAGAFCESSLLRIATYGNRSPKSTTPALESSTHQPNINTSVHKSAYIRQLTERSDN